MQSDNSCSVIGPTRANLTMSERCRARVAIIYDDVVRPDTTGVYCLHALQSFADVQHFLPAQLPEVPRSGFDLYLYIDDGLSYLLPTDLAPSAFWAIDTHIQPQRLLGRLPVMDFVFAAQRDGVNLLRGNGINCLGWLPLACDPRVHRRHTVAKALDVCFVANLNTPARRELAALMTREFTNSFVGRRFFDEMAETYSASRLVLNLSIRNDVNMRVFEAAACGSLLLTNDLSDNGMGELFTAGEHLVTYRTLDELVDKARYYLAHEQERERIAEAGCRVALTRHTYVRRMEELLGRVDDELRRRGTSPSCEIISAPSPPSAVDPAGAKTSIVVLTLNQLEYTRACLDSVRACTIPPYELIVVDNGSTDGTVEYLRACHDVKLICNAENRGFPAAANQGIAAATGGYVLLLNNDTIVTTGWLERMHAAMASGDDVGLVGPCSNTVPGPQRVRASYDVGPADRPGGIPRVDAAELERYAEGRSRLHASRTVPVDVLVGFCLLIRRSVIARIGLLDEGFGPGTYEDYDFCRRAQFAGFRSLVACDAFVHHYGSVTLSEGAVDVLNLLEVNRRKFIRRWPNPDRSRPANNGADAPATANTGEGEGNRYTSIVIVTFNQLDRTRACLDSVRRCTTEQPYEIVVVDNGSTDGTRDYLLDQPDVRVVQNDANRGFPAAANQGIRFARGGRVLLLNNDVVVTPGWLTRMARALAASVDVGLVGTCSNNVSGPQRMPARYDLDGPNGLEGLNSFAEQSAGRHAGVLQDVERLVGFCLLIRRDVIERVGLLDERFGIGNFEDDDYCRRALAAGFRCVIARDAFVHHHGSATFRATGVDYAALMTRNRRLFEEKWGQPTDPPGTGSSEGDRSPPPPTPAMLSMCMIARDSSRTIGAALRSIRPWVDELIVVDTGSTDHTIAVSEAAGARVYHFPWSDDFSAARNHSLKYATGDWVLWMDSDDTIDEENGRKLKELVAQPIDPQVLGFVMQVRCPGAEADGVASDTLVDHVKMFRNLPSLRFEGRIHEQILPAIRRAGGEVAWTDIFVTHSGSDQTAAGRQRKHERDLRILELELRDRPGHPFTLFNLGMTYADMGRHAEAIDALEKSRAASEPDESHVRKVYALLTGSYAALDERAVAVQVCREGLELFPEDPELLFRSALLHQLAGETDKARTCYRALIDSPAKRHFSSMDRGIRGFKAHHNLALLEAESGRLPEAVAAWREALRETPLFRPAWEGMVDALIQLERLDEAHDACALMGAHARLRCAALVLRAKVAAARGHDDASNECLHDARELDPTDPELLTVVAQRSFERGDLFGAERTLLDLTRADGYAGAAYHNLGCVYARLNRTADARSCFERSLEERPNSALTRQMLRQLEPQGHGTGTTSIA